MSQTDKRKRGRGSVISDPRFARLHTDARFQVFPNKQRKVEIDERFKGVLTDERFQHRAPVDKRGRKVKKVKKNEDLARYYRLQDEDDATAEEGAQQPELPRKPAAHKKQNKKAKRKATSTSAALETTNELHGVTEAGRQPCLTEDEQQRQPVSDAGELLESEPGAESESESEEEDDDAEAAASRRWARMRGLAGPETSSGDGDASDSDTDAELPQPDDDEEEVDPSEFGVGALAANFDEEVPTMEGEGTRRLALLDMDWEHVRAVDILMVLRSFLVEGQRVERVTVYPSDFGIEQMAAEARLGPQSVFASRARLAESGRSANGKPAAGAEADDDEEEEEEGSDEDGVPGAAGRRASDSDSDAEVNQARLRMYERSKLRYYFAVIECDRVSTAGHLYAQCDGLEFELSANRMDLRFIPDAQSFADRKDRDTATDAPPDYGPPPFFATAALQHSNVKLTWDATPDERRRALSKKVKPEELRDDDFKAYLGSDSEDEGQDGQAQEAVSIEEYRRRLLAGAGIEGAQRKGGKDWGTAQGSGDDEDSSSEGQDEQGGGAKAEGDVDMQVTFDSGLETLGERLASKKGSKAAETLWQQYEKRRREKKQAAKRMGKHHVSSSEDDSDGADSGDEGARTEKDDPFLAPEEDPFSDPFFQSGEEKRGAQTASEKEAKRREREQRREAAAAEAAEARRKQAELELLLMDESEKRQGKPTGEDGGKPGKVKLSRKERARLNREARRQERKAGSDDEDLAADAPAFKAKLDDARFAAMFSDPAYALDPTDPRFAQSAGAQELAAVVARRKQKQRGSTRTEPAETLKVLPSGRHQPSGDSGKSASESAQLKVMVAALKNRGTKMLKQKGPRPGKASKVVGL